MNIRAMENLVVDGRRCAASTQHIGTSQATNTVTSNSGKYDDGIRSLRGMNISTGVVTSDHKHASQNRSLGPGQDSGTGESVPGAS